jgi:hypothetical protein
LIRDRKFTTSFDAFLAADGARILKCPVRAPRAIAICERVIGTFRRECLDKMLILGRRHLETALSEYVEHYGCKSSGSSEGSPFGDELAIGPFGMDGDLLLLDALVSRGVNPAAAALAANLGAPAVSSIRRRFSAVSEGRPKLYSSSFVSMCQKRTTSIRATATVATLTLRRARIRSAKAWSGPRDSERLPRRTRREPSGRWRCPAWRSSRDELARSRTGGPLDPSRDSSRAGSGSQNG